MLILIADDEHLARFTLKSMLANLLPQPYTVLEASNGKAFAELCKANRPDIAFVDINMPQLDGISAIEQCKNSLPLTQFVITTCYSDFAYAQKCVSLGVTEYLLKPLEEAKLAVLLARLTEHLATSRRAENSSFQVALMHFFQSMDEAGSYDEAHPDFAGEYTLFEFFIDCPRPPHLYSESYRKLRHGLTATGEVLLEADLRYALFHSPEGNLRMVLLSTAQQYVRVCQQLDRLCRELTSPKVMLSALFVRGDTPAQLYRQAQELSRKAWLRYGQQPSAAGDLRYAAANETADEFLQLLDTALTAFFEVDEVLYRKTARELGGVKHCPAPQLIENAAAYARAITGCAVTAHTAKQLGAALSALIPQMYHGLPQDNETDKIEQIKSYILANYSSDISINLLAEKFYLTPNYLSKLFHEKAGVCFVDYLTEVRIANAKRILKQNPTVLVKDLAVMVGYFSARHFSTIFKRETGLYPAEFRDGTT